MPTPNLTILTGASQTKIILDRAHDPTDATNYGKPEPATYLNALTVTATLLDSDGDAIGDAVTMTYQTGSDGRYIGTFPSSIGDLVSVNGVYTVRITVASGSTTLVTYDVKARAQRPQGM